MGRVWGQDKARRDEARRDLVEEEEEETTRSGLRETTETVMRNGWERWESWSEL